MIIPCWTPSHWPEIFSGFMFIAFKSSFRLQTEYLSGMKICRDAGRNFFVFSENTSYTVFLSSENAVGWVKVMLLALPFACAITGL